MGLGGVWLSQHYPSNGDVCRPKSPPAFQLWLFLEIDHGTPKRYFQKVPEKHPWPGTLKPTGLSNSLLSILMMSHSMKLNINFVANLLASGQCHYAEKY